MGSGRRGRRAPGAQARKPADRRLEWSWPWCRDCMASSALKSAGCPFHCCSQGREGRPPGAWITADDLPWCSSACRGTTPAQSVEPRRSRDRRRRLSPWRCSSGTRRVNARRPRMRAPRVPFDRGRRRARQVRARCAQSGARPGRCTIGSSSRLDSPPRAPGPARVRSSRRRFLRLNRRARTAPTMTAGKRMRDALSRARRSDRHRRAPCGRRWCDSNTSGRRGSPRDSSAASPAGSCRRTGRAGRAPSSARPRRASRRWRAPARGAVRLRRAAPG